MTWDLFLSAGPRPVGVAKVKYLNIDFTATDVTQIQVFPVCVVHVVYVCA